ncbi:hypothetical protein [Cognatishimia sp. F0-27]|uniref:hypothetical protein n=1 Tax=Cognatishimia sp. F0-27 TaxID=2816855 RepID=UPI001D0C328E|nr:hypothetical protein [Cognatishimia sp. F0-27]MCC1494047.1 hypothetical protein [Cognatishimia sp. F0-27]
MSRAAKIGIASALAILAVILLGYAAYDLRMKNQALQQQIDRLQQDLSSAQIENQVFYQSLLGVAFEEQIQALAAAETVEDREQIAIRIEIALKGQRAFFPDGYYILSDIKSLVPILDADERQARAQAFLENTVSLAQFVLDDLVEETIVIDTKTVSALTGLITAIGGFGSGLGSFLLFMMSGGRREIEEQMMELDLEMKRIELAKAKHAARDVLVGASK